MRLAPVVLVVLVILGTGACPGPDAGPDAGPGPVECTGDDVVFAGPPVDAGFVPESQPCEPPELFDAPTSLCGADGWCWETPRAGMLAGSVGAAAGQVFVGYARVEGDTLIDVPLRQMPFAEVPRDPPGRRITPQSVSGVAPDDVWAIIDDGPIHYDGTAWELDASRVCRNFPRAIFAAAPDDVWLVGARTVTFRRIELVEPDALAHFDGTRWESIDVPEQIALAAVDGRSPDDVWFVGSALIEPEEGIVPPAARSVGVMGHFDGAATTFDVFEALPPLQAVYVHPDGTVWAAGAQRTVTNGEVELLPVLFSRGEGGCGAEVPPCNIVQLAGVRGLTVWARCEDGDVARWDGAAWQLFDDVGATQLAVVADDDVWTGSGRIVDGVFTEGTPFGAQTPSPILALELEDIDGGDALAMTATDLLKRTDGTWARVDVDGAPSGYTHMDVRNGVAMAIAPDGVTVFDGTSWRVVDGPVSLLTPQELCVVSVTEAYAVDFNQGINPGEGENEGDPTIARFDGTAWAVEEDTDGFVSVSCAGDGFVVASSFNGVSLREDGVWTHSAAPGVRFEPRFLIPDFKPQLAFAHSPSAWWVMGGVLWDGTDWRRGSPADDEEFVATAARGADGNSYALVAVDPFNPSGAHRLQRIAPEGAITTAATLTLSSPQKMFGSPSGALWVQDSTGLVRIDGDVVTATVPLPGSPGDLFLADDTFALLWDRAGAMMRWDGVSWSEDAGFPAPGGGGAFLPGVEDIFGFSAVDVWAGYGSTAEVAHWDGASWSVSVLDGGLAGEGVYAVWGAAPDEVWVVGRNGTLWRGGVGGFVREREGQEFVRLGQTAHAVVVGSASNDLWFLGVSFEALRWDGLSFSSEQTLPNVVGAASFNGELVLVDRFTGAFWGRAAGRFVQGDASIAFDSDPLVQENLIDVVLTGPQSGRALVYNFDETQTLSLLRFSPETDERITVQQPRFDAFPIRALAVDELVLAGPRGILRRQD